ncbi:rRNA maturation RNase YbeY [Desulfovibrio psychrotolerans]|uniref:Endoribonuclease YbeY n=1 Tax=Desulfovibrio psychrotolerans TaxID=415242 RepID=A0A7J0BPK8_9BACT|nr:rRNA maturation RNase YbeY [Desulfovibrio psychrotolerans]GFM35633.1 endoribonuclease YbeY [Desulfovibrio psychrotolerans]
MIRIAKTPGITWMLPLCTRELRAAAAVICTHIGHDGASLDINLVDDAEIAELNSAFLGCHGPTNILSFPVGTEEKDEPAAHADISAHATGWKISSPESPNTLAGTLYSAGTDAASGQADARANCHIGWLALSLETTVREAHLYGQDISEHAIRLLAHGILHLAGYDHSEEMFSLTESALNAALDSLSS